MVLSDSFDSMHLEIQFLENQTYTVITEDNSDPGVQAGVTRNLVKLI